MMGRMIEIWIVISPHRQTPQKTHVSRGGSTRRRGGSAMAAMAAAAAQASQAIVVTLREPNSATAAAVRLLG